MEVTRKQRTPNCPENEIFLRTCAYQGVRNVGGEIGVLWFLETPVLGFTLFYLITDVMWVDMKTFKMKSCFYLNLILSVKSFSGS